jgi:hypothetical protein
MSEEILMALLKSIRSAVDAAITVLENMICDEPECICPEQEKEIPADCTMGNVYRICKLCGKRHEIEVDDEGGDSE